MDKLSKKNIRKNTKYRNLENEVYLIYIMCILSVIIRSLFLDYSRQLYVIPDEAIYLNMAKSFYNEGKLLVHGVSSNIKYFLYSLVIAPFFSIEKESLRILCIGVFNNIMLTSGIVPVYILAKKILVNKKDIIGICFIFLILPDLAMGMTFMAENLYYPVFLWLMLLIYQYCVEKNYRKKLFLLFVITVACIILYAIKSVALFIPVGFFCLLFYEIFYNKEKWEYKVSNIIIYIALFLALYYIFDHIICIKILNIKPSYSLINFNINDIEHCLYLFFALVFNFLGMSLAFFIFPLILIVTNYNKYSEQLKKYIIFIFSSLSTVLFVISYKISIVEEYGNSGLRQHIRYYAPIFIIILIVCLKEDKLSIKKNLMYYIISIYMILYLIFFKTFYGVSVDGVMLEYIYYIRDNIIDIFPSITITQIDITFKLIIVVYVMSFLYFYRKNSYRKIFMGIIVFVCLVNNFFSIDSFKREQKSDNKKIEDIKRINMLVKNVEGKEILIVSNEEFDKTIETYFRYSSPYISLEKLLENNNYIQSFSRIGNDKLDINYPPYRKIPELRRYKYILTNKNIEISGDEVEKIIYTKKDDYFNLYRVKGKNIEVKDTASIFPQIIGEEVVLTAQSEELFTQFSKKNNKIISDSNMEKALIYGPYQKINPGIYKIGFYYHHLESNNRTQNIGYVDIVDSTSGKVLNKKKINNKDNKVIIENLCIREPILKLELRIFVNHPNIQFDKIKIKKIQ